MAEKIDVLNSFGEKTWDILDRDTIHKLGKWHRGIRVFILNDKNQVLLQQRSANKESYPNIWDLSAAGHVESGSTSIDTAIREVSEELGLTITRDELNYLGTHTDSDNISENFIGNAFYDIFFVQKNVDITTLTLQPDEVSNVKWLPFSELVDLVNSDHPEYIIDLIEIAMLSKKLNYASTRPTCE